MYQARTPRWPRRFSIAICVAALAGAEAQPPALDQEIALVTPKAESASIDAEAMGAIAPCAVCHGSTGEGNPALDTPRIAGLDAQYLARQLEYFRMSVRGATDEDKYGTQMRAIALTLK